jgi:hypothetical protein
MQESSADAENKGPITFQEARDLLWKNHHNPTKNQHTSPPSKSRNPEPKDSPTNSQGQVCSECKGKTLTVGSPVTVKLQCPELTRQRIEDLENTVAELNEIISPLQRGVKWVSGENLKLKRRVVSLEHELDSPAASARY